MMYDSKKQKFELGDLVWYENLSQIKEMQSRGISTGPLSGIVIDLLNADSGCHSADGAFSAAVKIKWLYGLEPIWYTGYNIHHLGYITIMARAASQRVNPQLDNAHPDGGKRELQNNTSDARGCRTIDYRWNLSAEPQPG